MDDLGVDQAAQHELFLLSQLSTQGAECANQVIALLLKKVSDGHSSYSDRPALHNPSGFVHNNCKKARHQLMAENAHLTW